jgi:hypothetical protein
MKQRDEVFLGAAVIGTILLCFIAVLIFTPNNMIPTGVYLFLLGVLAFLIGLLLLRL